MASADLSQARLEDALRSWSPAVRYLEQTDSTNTVAMNWAKEGAPEGAIVVADFQTAGRGRLGRSWFGKPGASIHLSLVLRPKINVEAIGLLNLAAAVAVCRALAQHEFESKIKWPNDVLINERKVCGILAETHFDRGSVSSVVLGVGINVNLRAEDLPEEIAATATSLLIQSAKQFDRIEIIAGFLNAFGNLYSALPSKPDYVVDAYRPLCSTLGRQVRIEMSDRVIEGRVSEVDSTGTLILESGQAVRFGDIVHLR